MRELQLEYLQIKGLNIQMKNKVTSPLLTRNEGLKVRLYLFGHIFVKLRL